MIRAISRLAALAPLFLAAGAAKAQDAAEDDLAIIGQPHERGIDWQPAATELARDIHALDYLVLVIISLIVLLVVGLLAFVIVRYNRRANAEPAAFTHNTPVEVAWTIVPILILLVVAAFSLPVLFKQQIIPEGDITIKATGNQWYWSYEYVDNEFSFDSYMIGHPATLSDEFPGAVPFVLNEAMEQRLERDGFDRDQWLLATDTAMVVPVGKTIVMQITAADVIHSWTIPAFGVKQDGVPGRIAEAWFTVDRPGVYFGQCSELCGKDHAYMPITVIAVSEAEYNDWLDGAIEQYAGKPRAEAGTEVALAD